MGRVNKKIKDLADIVSDSLRVKDTWIIKKGNAECSSCGKIDVKENIISKNPKCPTCKKQTLILKYPEINQTEYRDYYDSIKDELNLDDESDIFSDAKENVDEKEIDEEVKPFSGNSLKDQLKKDVTKESKQKEIDEDVLKEKLKKKLDDNPKLKKRIEKRIPEEKRNTLISKLAHSIATKDISVLNTFFPDDMQLTEDEKQMIQEDWEMVLEHYSDKLEKILEWIPVLMLVVSHGLIIGSRMKTYFKDKEKKEKEEKAKKEEKLKNMTPEEKKEIKKKEIEYLKSKSKSKKKRR